MRGQHPYPHPTAAVIPVGIAVGIINVIATIAVAKRATTGLSGRSRLRPFEIGLAALMWIAVFAAMAVMASAGVSDRIVYGLYPATVPLIIAGCIWAVVMAARSAHREALSGLAAAAVGAVALLSGPVGAWAVVGVGICIVLLVRATETFRRQHA